MALRGGQRSVTPGATQGSCLPGCEAPHAVSCQRGSFGMLLLLHVDGLEVSGSSCASVHNEENNETVREVFSQY